MILASLLAGIEDEGKRKWKVMLTCYPNNHITTNEEPHNRNKLHF